MSPQAPPDPRDRGSVGKVQVRLAQRASEPRIAIDERQRVGVAEMHLERAATYSSRDNLLGSRQPRNGSDVYAAHVVPRPGVCEEEIAHGFSAPEVNHSYVRWIPSSSSIAAIDPSS